MGIIVDGFDGLTIELRTISVIVRDPRSESGDKRIVGDEDSFEINYVDIQTVIEALRHAKKYRRDQ